MLESNKKEEKVDRIIAMCVYLILSMKYHFVFQKAKESRSMKEGDIVATLFKWYTNYKQSFEELLLSYIFDEYSVKEQEVFSLIIYSAFASIIFDVTFDLDKPISLIDIMNKANKNTIIIKRRIILKHLILNIRSFDQVVVNIFLNTLKELLTSKEALNEILREGDDLLNNFLSLYIQLPNNEIALQFYVDILASATCKPHIFIYSCVRLTGLPTIKLSIINSFLGKCIENSVSLDHSIHSAFLYLLQIVEDSIKELPDLLCSEQLIEVMSKFLIITNTLNILYVSVPVLTQFDKSIYKKYLKFSSDSNILV